MNRVTHTTLVVVTVTVTHMLCARRGFERRVLYGHPDTHNTYSFVVAILSDLDRFCNGVLIYPEWVVTAGHCIFGNDHGHFGTHVQYGDMSQPPNSTQSKAAIIKQIKHPGYRYIQAINDIGLLLVTPISLPVFGTISTVDYTSLMGLSVEYAGLGRTENDEDDDNTRLVVIGEGVIKSCTELQSEHYLPGLYLCVAPKCSNRKERSGTGDSGSPLFCDNKLVGILSAIVWRTGCFTAVSPYITWIREVVTSDRSGIR